MKSTLLLFVTIILTACTGTNRINRIIQQKTDHDTTARIGSLTDTTSNTYVYYITPDGGKILLRNAKGTPLAPDTAETDTEISPVLFASADVAGSASADDVFTGSVRATVKTTYSSAPKKTYATIRGLYRSLKSKSFMDSLKIGHRDTRSKYEDRNVVITTAYLYTITIEDDNDFHLLIGNTPVYEAGITRVFNAEIPGVPPNGTAAEKNKIKQLRAKLLQQFGAIPVCGRNGYLQEHTKIRISGSLFYDTQHKSNPARCKDVEGESAWEIHPVLNIEKK